MTSRARVLKTFPFGNLRLWLAVFAAMALVLIANLGQASEATLTGQRLHDLQDRVDRTERENAQIEFEIATLMAPDKMETRARALGLRPATSAQVRFMTVKDYPNPENVTASPMTTAGPNPASPSNTGSLLVDLMSLIRQLFSPLIQSSPNP